MHAMCQYVISLQIWQSSKEDKKVRRQIKYSVGDKEQGEGGHGRMLLRLGHQSLSLRRCCLSKTRRTLVSAFENEKGMQFQAEVITEARRS